MKHCNPTNVSYVIQTALCFAWIISPLTISAQVDVLTHHNNRERTGVNLEENALTPANVNSRQFGMLFKRLVDDQLYSQPLLVTGVKYRRLARCHICDDGQQ